MRQTAVGKHLKEMNHIETIKSFKTGNVVKGSRHPLKMTVEKSNEQHTHCVYFDENEQLQRVIYRTNELEFLSH
ncbi:hypothetical protein F3C99_14420 [Vitellibacter sp. q18]|nr:hypothetical protein [Aequorivita lutea]